MAGSMTRIQGEYLSISDAMKRCRGEEFEQYDHPAVLLDRVTDDSVRVWGWWTKTDPALPCLLWSGPRGWSITVVEPDEIGAPGYELAHWSHRVKLLDLAFANALGPHRTLDLLELYVAADTTLALGPDGPGIREALIWGMVQLRAARAQTGGRIEGSVSGAVDDELAQHELSPTFAKPRPNTSTDRDRHKDPVMGALVRALSEFRLTGNLAALE